MKIEFCCEAIVCLVNQNDHETEFKCVETSAGRKVEFNFYHLPHAEIKLCPFCGSKIEVKIKK